MAGLTLKQRNWILIALVLVVLAVLKVANARKIEPTGYFDAPRPMVIAHQGGDGRRPGNTLAAFDHAHALGADVLEMDLHATSDGTLVLMHDETVDRTTDGTGAIREMLIADIKALDAGYRWVGPGDTRPYRGVGLKVPTLAEVLARFPAARFNIEIKQEDPPIGAALCERLGEFDARERTLVASFHSSAMQDFREQCRGVATSAFRTEVMGFLAHHYTGISRFYSPAAHALQLPPESSGVDLTGAELFRNARMRGMHVDIWTVNDAAVMQELIQRRVGGIITDRPDRMLRLLERLPAGTADP